MFFPPERRPAAEAAAPAPATPESGSQRRLPVPIALDGTSAHHSAANGHTHGKQGDIVMMMAALDVDDQPIDEELAPDAFCCPITHVRICCSIVLCALLLYHGSALAYIT